MAGEDEVPPEVAIAQLFRLAGHDVSEVAGASPGTVDWFAMPREGFVRPRTYWCAWETCPEPLEDALADLERARVARRADRALAVVMEGRLPDGYVAEPDATTRVVSYRRFALDVSGISARVADQAAAYAAQGGLDRYFPRRATLVGGAPDDADLILREWVRNGDTDLALWGASVSESLAVINHVAYGIAREFAKDPERVTPLVRIEERLGELTRVPAAIAEGFAVPVLRSISDLRLCAKGLLIDIEDGDGERWEGPGLQVLPVSATETERWFQDHLSDPNTYLRFARTRDREAAFRALSDDSINAGRLFVAMTAVNIAPGESDRGWLVRVVAAYMQRVLEDMRDHLRSVVSFDAVVGALEDGAIEELALGGARRHHGGGWNATIDVASDLPYVVWAWTAVEEGRYTTNRLVRDYLIARRIERELAAGHRNLLARHDLPEEYVLLFLATLSPEAAAQAAYGRTAEIRAEIEAEVERRLQLTLAHMLKRSAGAVRSHVKTIHRHLQRTAAGALDLQFARIEEEIAFQCALAEQTRRLYEVPESDIEGLCLEAVASSVAADLRDTYPRVSFESTIDPALRVRASRDILREILHALLENAFHAVVSVAGLAAPSVRVEAHREGATIRLNVLDNGPGIAPGDGERIFDLYVTTKKGGDDNPLGTGMGLPIARRYAEHVGAQLGLDPEQEQTCFFVRFVAWRDIG